MLYTTVKGREIEREGKKYRRKGERNRQGKRRREKRRKRGYIII